MGNICIKKANIENPPIQGIISYAVKGIFEKIKEANKFQFLLF